MWKCTAKGRVRGSGRSEKMKLLSSRKATLQPEATLFSSCRRRESCRLARPVLPTLGSAVCMRTACKRQRKPRCIESKSLGPGEFTQRVTINPSLSDSSIQLSPAMPVKCDFAVKQSKSVLATSPLLRILDRRGCCILVESVKRHRCGESPHACVHFHSK